MITHSIVPTGPDRPSPFGGLAVEYRCNCGCVFTSQAADPVCPLWLDYRAGLRAGRRTKRARTRLVYQPWMSRIFCRGYRETRGVLPQGAPAGIHPDARMDPEGHRESVAAASARAVAEEEESDG